MSLDIDSSGNIHISYGSSSGLRYASFNGADWNIQTIDASGGGFSSLGLTDTGYARIAYSVGTTVKYASSNGANWVIQTINTDSSNGGFVALALDSSGYGQVSFANADSGTLYAGFDGSGWTVDVADEGLPSPSVTSSSIDMDSVGNAHIVYFDEVYSYPIGEAICTVSGGCSFNANFGLTPQDVYGSAISLQMDNDLVHVSYYSENNNLAYTYDTGSGFVTYIVDSAGDVGQNSSLILDAQGHPYISYLEKIGSLYNLKLAHFNGTAWTLETLYTNVGYWGGSPSESAIALYNDYLYLTFAQADGSLVSATNAPLGLVSEPTSGMLGKIIIFFFSFIFGIKLYGKSFD